MSRTASIGICILFAVVLVLGGCSGSKNTTSPPGGPIVHPEDIPVVHNTYVVFAWNDLGMHCLNPTYDQLVVLPPYNTVWAQVVKRGNPPQIVTAGLTADYRIINNTYSYGKTDSRGASFAGFWDNSLPLFGLSLPHNLGLNLEDPGIHNGLAGSMVVKGSHFQVNGVPLTPVSDMGIWNPYQIIEVTIRSGGQIVAQTQAVAPTSDEMNCAKCHTKTGETVFHNILAAHDRLHATTLLSQTPVLCAKCHGDPALGQTGPGSSGEYLSLAVHKSHASRNAACYDCHPGATTKCSRSARHTAAGGNCIECHGTMAQVAQGIQNGTRLPWVNEPKCLTCHGNGVPEVDTGTALYRNSQGHGGMSCPACHNSPHAMYPSTLTADNYQPLNYQNSNKSVGSCGTCHETSRGEGISDFADEHGGQTGRPTACAVCHTQVTTNTAQWPHQFMWRATPGAGGGGGGD